MTPIEDHPYATIEGLKTQLNLKDDEIKRQGFKNGGIWFPETKSIVCGTFPPEKEYKNRQGYMYYPSSRNKFWKHIDAIYKTKLFSSESDSKLRIDNALKKIDFAQKNNLGFVDIYSKISRKVEGSAADKNLEEKETIFYKNSILNNILESNVYQFIFVYRHSRDKFLSKLKEFDNSITPESIRKYKKDNIPLDVKYIELSGKELFLTYSPILGPIRQELKQQALKKAIEFDFT